MLGKHGGRMNQEGFDSLLSEKCSVCAVSFARPDDFFHEAMLAYIEETWEQWLGPFVPGIPSFL